MTDEMTELLKQAEAQVGSTDAKGKGRRKAAPAAAPAPEPSPAPEPEPEPAESEPAESEPELHEPAEPDSEPDAPDAPAEPPEPDPSRDEPVAAAILDLFHAPPCASIEEAEQAARAAVAEVILRPTPFKPYIGQYVTLVVGPNDAHVTLQDGVPKEVPADLVDALVSYECDLFSIHQL